MKEFVIIIVSVLLATFMLCQSIMDFRANRILIASLEFIMAITWTSSAICTVCYVTLHTII